MTIRIYPSRLEGEPIETHSTKGGMSVHQWLTSEVKGYTPDTPPQFTVTINGCRIEPDEFPLTQFGSDDDVQIHVEAHGFDPLTALFYAAIVLLSVAIYMMMPKLGNTNNRQGRTMSDQGILANTRRYGEPIREVAGSPIIYPDFIVPPFRYYRTFRQQWCSALLCIGKGTFEKSLANVKIGDTPVLALGDDVEIKFYEPGADLSNEPAAVWWHTPEEVGFTTQGNAGMTLGATTDVERVWGSEFTFLGMTISSPTPVPESWAIGMFVRVEADHPVMFGVDWVSSPMLDSLDLSTSEEIELTGQNAGIYTIASIVPGSGPTTGSPASVTANSPPARLDFGTTMANLALSINGAAYGVTLATTVANIGELVTLINSQLTATPFQAGETAGNLSFTQRAPYTGGDIMLSGSGFLDLMGASQVYVSGVASAAATGARYRLASSSFPVGEQVISVGRAGLLMAITTMTEDSIAVEPVGVTSWSGFPASVSNAESYVSLSTESIEGGWQGWFTATPEGEKANGFQVDIFFPRGIIRYNSKGHARDVTVEGEIQWRVNGSADIFSHEYTHTAATPDQIGITFGFELDVPGKLEVRVRAKNPPSDDSKVNDVQQWASLRARIVGAPTSYEGVTLMSVLMRSGDQIAGAVENKVSIRAARILPTLEDPAVSAPTRAIAPFFVHMLDTVGYGRDKIDMAHLESLHGIWEARGDTFDLSFETAGTLKTAANMCLNAGFAELTVRGGLVVPVRDSVRPLFPTRMYTVGDYTRPLVESTEAVQPDDIDGVDAEYVDYLTGRTTTVQYRLPSDAGRRVEKITVPGVTNKTRAWRLAARRRRVAAYRRTQFSGGTELQAMNSHYWDHVGLQDGIPRYGQSAFAISVTGATVELSEEIKPVDGDLIAVARRRDGTSTKPVAVVLSTDGKRVTFPDGLPTEIVSGPGAERATVFLFGAEDFIYHPAFITSIQPSTDGRVDFTAVNYDPRVYADDDGGLDMVTLTSYEYKDTRRTSMLYPYEFGDAISTAPLEPSTWSTGWWVADTMSVQWMTPSISVASSVIYSEYRNWTPERLQTTWLTPSITVSTLVIYSTYRMQPETLTVTQLQPVVSVSNLVVTYALWTPEQISTTQLAPTITVTTP